MHNKKTIIYILVGILLVLIISYFSLQIMNLFCDIKGDIDYKILGLDIERNDIEYATIYDYDLFTKYKVYKLKNYYNDSMQELEKQLEKSNLWSKDKFYEYMMVEFYEIKDGKRIDIDRENLYYYHKEDIYAIFDLKNAKLYYFVENLFAGNPYYDEILGIKIDEYNDREVYSVRCGMQYDGTDYYTYDFTKEKGEEIQENLNNNSEWTKVPINEKILEIFEYNAEVKFIQNGYYYYKDICRTSDLEKQHNFTKEEATGFEIGIYDINENRLYYYWTSY